MYVTHYKKEDFFLKKPSFFGLLLKILKRLSYGVIMIGHENNKIKQKWFLYELIAYPGLAISRIPVEGHNVVANWHEHFRMKQMRRNHSTGKQCESRYIFVCFSHV